MMNEGDVKWRCGQRWVSDGEPELGLGILRAVADGRVEMAFRAAGETRIYAADSAALRRVEFSAGDLIADREGRELRVVAVRVVAGLRIYVTVAGELAESELSDTISFSKPAERLYGGTLAEPGEFELRGEALRRQAALRRSAVRGLAGARMDLIPHQLFIADEVAGRLRPRVLLADEVGLGKTIEACLILHRLILTGRAERVLILVPEPLVHQWFVELLRRFQLAFSIFDEERCEAIEAGEPGCNPFLDSQWVLAAVELGLASELRAAQLQAAGWDVLVVDEAHHLRGPAYEMVRVLAAETEGLLLLTATPQQLGPEGHFARLQLLDPQRYRDAERHAEETRGYEEVADVVAELQAGGAVNERLQALAAGSGRLEQRVAELVADLPQARERLIAALLDGFGIGRVMFRNTRARLGGFPERQPRLVEMADKGKWLIALLAKLAAEKVLVIAKSRELAEAIVAQLSERTTIPSALFHEDLTLLQRDRNAAYFAEAEGAQVLVCSEIGSEGRNFQFARHLVLYDLPEDVDLLEQRIGRLDRIGQKGVIQVHVPYLAGEAEEVRLRWLEHGLDAFRTSPPGAAEIQHELRYELGEALDEPPLLDELLVKTLACRKRIGERLARGQDRLLEQSSHRPAKSAALVAQIRAWDEDAGFEEFLLRLFESQGVQIEELGPRRYYLRPGDAVSAAFPALPGDGLTVTFDRQRALEREQEGFMTWDHPLVRGALDSLLGGDFGNAAFGVWEAGGEKLILLEAWLVVECVAPAKWQVERFLPPTPLRLLIDHKGHDHSADPAYQKPALRKGNPANLLRNEQVKRTFIPALLEQARALGREQSQAVIAAAQQQMEQEMAAEILRLKELAEVNDHIQPQEIAALEHRQTELAGALQAARVRLDAVRLIWKAPA
jgi:ATP-dependent helicase HepA